MGKNIIVGEETIRDLLEAHASLSAWYYQLWTALRAAGASAAPPDDAARTAFVERLAVDFPEVAAAARAIRVPRMFVPAPPAVAARRDEPAASDDQATLVEPAAARLRGMSPALEPVAPPSASASPAGVAPPPLVNPAKVKYAP
jgi:hypothetical protein